MISDKLLENQRKHQRRILFDEWDDNAPFQWNGNIESVIYTLFEAIDHKDNEPDWEESIRSELIFNENNKVVECIRYNCGKLCSRCLNEYNSIGMSVSSKLFDKSNRLIQVCGWKYDQDGNMIELTSDSQDHHNKFVFIYDSQRSLVQKLSYCNGKIDKGITYLYNELGYVTSSIELYSDGRQGITMAYKYDKNGNVLTSMIRDRSGHYTRYKYDIDGRIIETVEDGFKPKSFSIVSHYKTSAVWIEEFKYDDNGNVISMIAKNGDRIISHSEWKIKYRK